MLAIAIDTHVLREAAKALRAPTGFTARQIEAAYAAGAHDDHDCRFDDAPTFADFSAHVDEAAKEYVATRDHIALDLDLSAIAGTTTE
jgi:hypothetical protein